MTWSCDRTGTTAAEKFSFAIRVIHYSLKYIEIKKTKNIWSVTILLFYCIFEQINESLVGIFEKH